MKGPVASAVREIGSRGIVHQGVPLLGVNVAHFDVTATLVVFVCGHHFAVLALAPGRHGGEAVGADFARVVELGVARGLGAVEGWSWGTGWGVALIGEGVEA